MTKMVKKGFTLVELLFVMAIIAILAGFAIANLKDSTKVATENSIKNDVKNAIAVQQTYFSANQAYDTAADATPNSQGIVEGDNGTKFTVSKGNGLSTYSTDCSDGSKGLYVDVLNFDLGRHVSYNSCEDGTITNVEVAD